MKPLRRPLNNGFYPFAKDYKGLGKSMNMVFPFTVSVDGNSLIISSWMSDAISVFDLQHGRVTRNIDGITPTSDSMQRTAPHSAADAKR